MIFDWEELVVSAGHELRGDRGAVGAGRQVSDVALQVGDGPGLLRSVSETGGHAGRRS